MGERNEIADFKLLIADLFQIGTHEQFAIRNSQFAIRNSQLAIRHSQFSD
jgi:hypothetical protein